jgi:hypothetical protein
LKGEEGEKRNQSVMSVELRENARLGVIAVVGFDRKGVPAVLLEIGIGHANPWGSRGSNFARRTRVEKFASSEEVLEAIVRMMRDIASIRMRAWRYQGCYAKWIEDRRRAKVRYRRRAYYNGIRFSVHPHDKEVAEYLRWQEVFWSKQIEEYLRYRAHGIAMRLADIKRTGWYRGEKRTLAATRIIAMFTQSRTLRDPRVLSKLIPMLYPREPWPPRRVNPLLHFLLEEGVLGKRFHETLPHRPKRSEVRSLHAEVRFGMRRKNGMLVWRIAKQKGGL